jgi:hypothetical protein
MRWDSPFKLIRFTLPTHVSDFRSTPLPSLPLLSLIPHPTDHERHRGPTHRFVNGHTSHPLCCVTEAANGRTNSPVHFFCSTIPFKLCQLTSPVNCERGEMSNANETQVIRAKGAANDNTQWLQNLMNCDASWAGGPDQSLKTLQTTTDKTQDHLPIAIFNSAFDPINESCQDGWEC